MELREFQDIAITTDQFPRDDPNTRIIPLLGMAGEVGSLLEAYKKWLRDGTAHLLAADHFEDELGDILWYLANTASKFDLDLNVIAEKNIAKTRDRWPPAGSEPPYVLFDAGLEEREQIPRMMEVKFSDEVDKDGREFMALTINGAPAGNTLRDNAHDDDGYRFHDIFHLAHAAKLGWSPVVRGVLLRPDIRKRKSLPETDDVEDGGRAIVIDEAIVAYVWEYARLHNYLEGVKTLDFPVLKTVKMLTSRLEVRTRSAHQWEEAILAGYKVWRVIREQRGGTVLVDLEERTIEVAR